MRLLARRGVQPPARGAAIDIQCLPLHEADYLVLVVQLDVAHFAFRVFFDIDVHGLQSGGGGGVTCRRGDGSCGRPSSSIPFSSSSFFSSVSDLSPSLPLPVCQLPLDAFAARAAVDIPDLAIDRRHLLDKRQARGALIAPRELPEALHALVSERDDFGHAL
jgi:hypothetical protein